MIERVKKSSLSREIELLQGLARRRKAELHLVGGFLRDLHLGREGKDMDFAVAKGAISLARAFAVLIHGTFILLDKEAGCARVAKKKNGVLWTYDFADFRAPTIAGDIKGRDFTINTLSCDLFRLTGSADLKEVCRPNVKARQDLKAKCIRAVSARAFEDDPLRLLRAYSLAAQTGFRIEPLTLKFIRARVKLIRDVSPERVREEIFKVLESPRAARMLRQMHRDGLLFTALPQLQSMEGVVQGGYHHLDVWKHSLLVLEKLETVLGYFKDDAAVTAALEEVVAGGHTRRSLLRFACLLHDAGKPATRLKGPDGRTTFHGHEHEGRRIARIMARKLKMASRERFLLEDLVTLHLRPGYLSNFKKPSEKAVYRFLRDAKGEALAVVLLAMADQRATLGPLTTAYDAEHHDAVCRAVLQQLLAAQQAPVQAPFINGHDLIKELKLNPGPLFKKILAAVEEEKHLGKVTTREAALAFAAKVIATQAAMGVH